MGKLDFVVNLHFTVSLWDAIKFRLAGKELRIAIIEELKIRMEGQNG